MGSTTKRFINQPNNITTFAIRVDASTRIGTGHVMRCLTLAEKLTAHGINVIFLSKKHTGNLNSFIQQKGFELFALSAPKENIESQTDDKLWLGCPYQTDASECLQTLLANRPIDLLIIDHYSLDYRWQNMIKKGMNQQGLQKIMVIDDLANRVHNCDILLDQTLNRHHAQYQQLVPAHCQMLLGQDYMLLRDEFVRLRAKAKAHRKQKSHHLTQANILITMGGSDPDNISERVLLAIKKLHQDMPLIKATLVLSSKSNHINAINKLIKNIAWCQLIIDSQSMADLMLNADIAIGASGATAWERCCLGLPSLITVNAKNQQLIAKNLFTAGACINLGWHKKITPDTITTQLKNLLSNPQQYLSMVNHGFAACHGQGASMVAAALLSLISTQRIKPNAK